MARKTVTGLKERVIRRIALTHIAGSRLPDALRVARAVLRKGWKCTICPWEDAGDSPASMATKYRQSLKAMCQLSNDAVLSMKPHSLGFDCTQVGELLSLAQSSGARIQLDAQSPDTAARIFRFFQKVHAQYSNVGLTIPSRWNRSLRDAEYAVRHAIPVRVVKGMWSDPEFPNIDPRAAFLDLVEILARGGRHVSVATHDTVLIQEALQRLTTAGISCELELLVGLPLGVARIAEARGVPVRVYIPYGAAYVPYNVSYLATRPSMAGWILRDLSLGRRKEMLRESEGGGYVGT